MKFRIKIALCMIGLVSVLFGIGESLLLKTSFDQAIDRERKELYGVYQMVSGTLQVAGDINGSLIYEDIAGAIFKISAQNEDLWEMIRFREDGERLIFESGDTSLDASGVMPEEGTCDIRLQRDGTRDILCLSGVLMTEEGNVRLDMARDVTDLFMERQDWQRVCQGVFLFTVIICAFVSYSMALILTRNMRKLSDAAGEIAGGNLSCRVEVSSGDEIEQLGEDFNRMADHLEEKIRGLNDEIERRERFVGDFSHELKTPMTSIIGYADLIRSGMLDGKEAEEAGAYIVNEGKRLENLSMKLLNMLMIKKEPLEFLLCSPAVLIRRLEENTAPIYKKRGIALETRVQPGECLIEPDLVYCLLKNLVENAANAMPDSGGKIIITQKMIKNGCRIFVKDNGCGIPENSMKHLTDPFYRVDRSRSRQAGGTGLGLSLCREIADIHGGYIRFRSMAEKGTVVMVALKGVRNEEPS